MKRYLSLSALSVAAVIALAGCGSQTGPANDPPTPTQEAGSATQSATEASTLHNNVDVMFAQMMIPHHEQAVEMSDIMFAKDNINPEVTELAARIKDAQAPEIDSMTGWLEAWGEPVEIEGGMEGHHMGAMDGEAGMLSEDEMAELEAAEGEEASRIFLEFMTAHHIGAVDMAREEIKNGENPEAIALAEDIVESQEAEIQEMEALLEEL